MKKKTSNTAAIIAGCAVLALLNWFFAAGAMAEEDRLPRGAVARASGAGPTEARYGRSTTRYDHGVFGENVEGGSLVVVDDAGRRLEVVLPDELVFEDVSPRIVDLDGDGRKEIVTIRSSRFNGASVAVYEAAGDKLRERAATPPLGKPYRWLSIAGIADFRGLGKNEIAIVKTPHIGGRLELLSLHGSTLVSLYPARTGFTSHYFGAPFVSLAVAGDLKGRGAASLVIPEQDRRRIAIIDFRDTITVVKRLPVKDRVDRPLTITPGRQVAVQAAGNGAVQLIDPAH